MMRLCCKIAKVFAIQTRYVSLGVRVDLVKIRDRANWVD
jgi:hypothetical protein